jgi:hypothetical protein
MEQENLIFSGKGKIPIEGNGIGSRNPDAQKNMSLIYHQTAPEIDSLWIIQMLCTRLLFTSVLITL